MASAPADTTGAELSAAAEAVTSYQRRIGELVGRHLGSEREDLIAAIYEAERALRNAGRLLERAAKVARN